MFMISCSEVCEEHESLGSEELDEEEVRSTYKRKVRLYKEICASPVSFNLVYSYYLVRKGEGFRIPVLR